MAPFAAAAPVPAFAPLGSPVQASVFALMNAYLGVDTRFDPPPPDALPENVFQARARAHLGADVRLSERFRVRAEARADWRIVAQAGFARTKAEFVPTVGEAYLDSYFPALDLRIGNQLVPLGANAGFAPADVFNPRDLTESLLQGDPQDSRIPVFAIRAQGEIGVVRWLAAYAPFFTPDRFTLFGQDESLLQPGWGIPVPANPVDPSIEDALQQPLAQTRIPQAFGYLGDLALQVWGEVARTRIGATWVWAWEKLPTIVVDPELQAAAIANARGMQPSPALLLSLENRFRAGDTLYQAVYPRQHVFSAWASRLWGPVQLDADLSFTPLQTFQTEAMQPVRKPTWSWALGVTPAEASEWTYAIQYVGLAALHVHPDELLAVLEPATARGAERTAFLHLLFANIARRLWDDRIELAVRGGFEPIQRSFAIGPRVSYRPLDGLWVWLGAEVYQGPALSPFGYFGRNDQVLAGVRWEH